MDREGKLYLTVLLLFLMEISFFAYFSPGFTPDLILALTISSGILSEGSRGLAVGFSGGLLQDIFLGSVPGVYTVVKVLIGGVARIVGLNFFKKNLFLPPLALFLLSFLHDLLSLLLVKNLSSAYIPLIKNTVLPQALHNTAAGLIIYLLIYYFTFSDEVYYG
ncbi:MAG: rod shape-determining protein MreD [Halanaerobiaceae bacterium]